LHLPFAFRPGPRFIASPMLLPVTPGICYLVGAGPGDLGLVTLRAKECIEMADVVAYDYLVNKQVLGWMKPGAELLYVGKQAANHALPQEEINQLLIRKVLEGKVVTRLKGGDPYVFGRGGEEAQELHAAGCPFEVVPGISSTIAGPAYAGIPVTHRDFNTQLTIFTGHEDPTKEVSSLDFAKIAQADGVKVMLMGVGRMGELTGKLMDHGAAPATPVALIRWATTGRQQTLTGTLATIAGLVEQHGFKAPAVCVIGGTVALRPELNWFERRPLFGKRIVVTRTRNQAGALSSALKALGADTYEIPTIRIEKPLDLMEFGEMVQDSHRYEWIIFTSPNGVEAFFNLFFKLYKDARDIGAARIVAIGPGTAKKIAEYHLSVDFIPEKFVADTLVDELEAHAGSIDNQTFLWVRGESARDVVADKLLAKGAILDEAIAYRTVPETVDVTGGQERFREEGADVLTFASGSAVDHFMALKLPIAPETKIASIGPVTSAALKRHGLKAHITAVNHDIPGLVQAISAYFARKS
jgi:uroporphyrinogen III methyltransferase/synthase